MKSHSYCGTETKAERTAVKHGCGRFWLSIINCAVLPISSLLVTTLSLALAIGVYDVEEFYGYFSHPGILILNWLPVFLLQLLLYALFNRQWAAFLINSLFILLPSIGNFYKLKFRFEPFTFADMGSIAAGLHVAGSYHLTLNSRVLCALLCIVLGTPLIYAAARARLSAKHRLFCAALVLLAAFPLWKGIYSNRSLYTENTYRNNYIGDLTVQQNFIANGFVYPFLYSITDNQDLPPDGYSEADAAALLSGREGQDIPRGQAVNIMVIQLESFTDLERMGFADIDPKAYEFFRKIQAESVSGTLVANVIGGGTINTERCFLTGSCSLLSFSRPSYSFVRYFNEQGYMTTGGHPNRPDFYNRVNVAQYLGFQEYLFNDYYAQFTGGRWNCDAQFLPEAVASFRTLAVSGSPVFSFNVTLQGHGPYHHATVNNDRVYWHYAEASAEAADQINSYLSLVEETQEIL